MDLFGIPGTVIVQGGATAVLILAVIGILTGRIVPARSVDRLEKMYAEALQKETTRGDEWRAAAQAQDARNDLLVQQVTALVDTMRTMNAMLDAMQQVSRERRR